ncbi:hypothetical protein ACRE_064270 [Hapsidospora chrysogenum ATCC 11550]|uniref:Uncharacterized protein n=1 Tax=Hapsidospora chrysogenum (strain ATCC 11550 / CBS 779.69 / DSM 880 / IAM 14645 / JCM 23072 / IMI 49137) TaxID=857340 RepID=A0A086T0D6_HAPC1|nr:hypothetical protein ACRE_064270 [Hapsidospora chrysogenum ATCC 11550]
MESQGSGAKKMDDGSAPTDPMLDKLRKLLATTDEPQTTVDGKEAFDEEIEQMTQRQIEEAAGNLGINLQEWKARAKNEAKRKRAETSRARGPRESKSRPRSSLQLARTLRRRQQDYYYKYDEQVARGRPDRSWRQCSDPACNRTRCLYVDFIPMSFFKIAYGGDGRPAPRRYELFLDAVVKHLFGELQSEAKAQQRSLVDSFAGSPLVRGAFGQFYMLCKHRNWHPSSKEVARALAAIRTSVVYLVSRTRRNRPVPDAHKFHGGVMAPYPFSWTLHHLAMQFCVVTEAWRRYGLERGAPWDFGSDEIVADFLCAVLLNYHDMRRRGAAKVRPCNAVRLNQNWETWLDRYHMLRKCCTDSDSEDDEGDKPDETDCLEGFGEATVPWCSERMRESAGWNTG